MGTWKRLGARHGHPHLRVPITKGELQNSRMRTATSRAPAIWKDPDLELATHCAQNHCASHCARLPELCACPHSPTQGTRPPLPTCLLHFSSSARKFTPHPTFAILRLRSLQTRMGVVNL
ncbi:hypothetical protein TREES_T100013266 [Tupaia chinensis]|uniref:Uncharacterized protein n=1 Tax=Tupaia chinensis TaxID=246437 RepID=L9KL71_TUPCH|nr:hypothetical protein TREES_T100013266 [Tupaia chinensis]